MNLTHNRFKNITTRLLDNLIPSPPTLRHQTVRHSIPTSGAWDSETEQLHFLQFPFWNLNWNLNTFTRQWKVFVRLQQKSIHRDLGTVLWINRINFYFSCNTDSYRIEILSRFTTNLYSSTPQNINNLVIDHIIRT